MPEITDLTDEYIEQGSIMMTDEDMKKAVCLWLKIFHPEVKGGFDLVISPAGIFLKRLPDA